MDLDNLEASTGGAVENVHCGDSICIRAHDVTGGGQVKVDTHLADPTPYQIVCGSGCTLDGSAVAAVIASADTLIGGLVVPPVGAGSLAPGVTGALTQALDDFNKGLTGPGHCPSGD